MLHDDEVPDRWDGPDGGPLSRGEHNGKTGSILIDRLVLRRKIEAMKELGTVRSVSGST